MIEGRYEKPTKPGYYVGFCDHEWSVAAVKKDRVGTLYAWLCEIEECRNAIPLSDWGPQWFWVGPLPDPPEVKRDRD